ncbi:uncharacterized protein DUF3304 [Enterobacter sp. BIGb0383]|uniref:DUF3304 domain-containing protein n=1 Tax=unclassified Enterobacter TaxID=2608935 RepID=UPI000F49FDA1|nr:MULTISPECIES: DUF3304 domain-containing protein [unclassified Enterobacter]ROP61540.1 uncharacterized protein DUF3304 [Enterobacter sp. BIGb0383]ROS11701.1 uncharacterized protein DUF3304 [Enterobacter sp. BIGb0359]
MDLIKITLVKLPFIILLFGTSVLAGYGKAETWSGGDLRGVNHTKQQIYRFSVNGNGGRLNGNTCCISLPNQWRPGLKADVEWEVSTNDGLVKFPGYADWDKYEAWEKKIKEGIVKHRTTVDIPDYGDKKCGLTVHFLSCNRIKVTASCWALSRPEYPIKEPYDMEEPAICPE